ncbi:Plasma membrane sulfite pump involved in sulfite metabolism [Mucor velutinosus]|uniref:Plasma membrane sulfite pump involved in sulfite metabolism n=1 Tax=Mucor velutinosus TaxID=708070 RepID=A0AAN7I1L3_9FUNG|nr:Plasma membrane sulfite pump involved in sulfite metabolism [Mucor velutinosus]
MKSKESVIKTLENCAVQAVSVLSSIVEKDADANIDDSYEELKASKHPVYDNSLFRNTSSLLSTSEDEPASEEEKAFVKRLVAQIDLASFAYHISRNKEYQTCVNAYFQRAVPSFNKYTKNEIQLFLCLRLFLLRRDMNGDPDANRTDLINKHFPKKPKTYFFNDEFSEKEAGRRQIIMAVNIVSDFLCSKASDLDKEVRFGAVVMVEKFLHEYIQYRMDENFDCEPDREIEQEFPETEDEMKALVYEIFNEDFIDKLNDEMSTNNSDAEPYAAEEDSEVDEEDSDSENGDSESESDKSSSTLSTNNDSDTEIPANLPVNEDGEEDELPDEEEEESTSKSRATTSRHRITDEQPGARAVTAQEADFSDDTGVGPSRRSSNASTSYSNTTKSRRRRRLPHSSEQSLRKRRALADRGHISPVSGGSTDDTSVNEHVEQEETPPLPPPPLKFHICDDGRARVVPPVPKIREKAQRWTEEEVQALEEGLRYYKRNAWSSIHKMFKDVLGSHKPTQLKDKAKNEVKRRQSHGIPLEGFQYFLNPQK